MTVGREYLEEFKKTAERYIPQWLINEIHKTARSGAGGRDAIPTYLEKMAIDDIRPAKLRDAPDQEIRSIWLRLHQWYANARRRNRTTEPFTNAAVWIIDEMKRRGMDFDLESDLVQEASQLKEVGERFGLGRCFYRLPREIPVVNDFVSIVGSSAEHRDSPDDLDVLLRADHSAEKRRFLLQDDVVWVSLRRHLDPEKKGGIHFITSPQGSVSDNVPLYDLVLRRRPVFDVNVVSGEQGEDGQCSQLIDAKEPVFKAVVLKAIESDGKWEYISGVEPCREFKVPTICVDDKEWVPIHKSQPTDVKAEPGDVVSVLMEDAVTVISDRKPDRILFGCMDAKVVECDKSRDKPDSILQVLDLAARKGILQNAIVKHMDGDPSVSGLESLGYGVTRVEKEDDEGGGETRAALSQRNWENNWVDMLPRKGTTGRFVYQHHWQGLDEDQVDLDDGKLRTTDHSLHGDIRLEGDNALWGWTVFLGRGKDQPEATGDKLFSLDEKNLQTFPKLAQPKQWLTIASKKPFVVEPGETSLGVTAKKWSKFIEMDSGTYQIGYVKRHAIEVFFNGKHLKGRYIIQFASVAKGRRVWLIDRPKDQEPALDKIDLPAEVKDQKSKGRRWLYLAKPGMTKPKIIDLKKTNPEDIAEVRKEATDNKVVPIKKVDDERRLVYGIVLEPKLTEDGEKIGDPDTQGHRMRPSEIERTAHHWMRESRVIGFRHKKVSQGIPVESWINRSDSWEGFAIIPGTWLICVYVPDDETWNSIKRGEITSFSPGGFSEEREVQN